MAHYSLDFAFANSKSVWFYTHRHTCARMFLQMTALQGKSSFVCYSTYFVIFLIVSICVQGRRLLLPLPWALDIRHSRLRTEGCLLETDTWHSLPGCSFLLMSHTWPIFRSNQKCQGINTLGISPRHIIVKDLEAQYSSFFTPQLG